MRILCTRNFVLGVAMVRALYNTGSIMGSMVASVGSLKP